MLVHVPPLAREHFELASECVASIERDQAGRALADEGRGVSFALTAEASGVDGAVRTPQA